MSTQPLVLVSDDEPRITKLVSIALGEEGFRVVTANGGEEALLKAEEEVTIGRRIEVGQIALRRALGRVPFATAKLLALVELKRSFTQLIK